MIASRKRRKSAIAALFFSGLVMVAVGVLLAIGRAPQTNDEAQNTADAFPPFRVVSPLPALSTDDPLLRLINRENPLPDDFTPALTELDDWNLQIASVAYDDLCAMLAAGRAEGLRFQICSAYRPRQTQQELFDEDVSNLVAEGWDYESAVEETSRYTMPPGCSEHESGLALDIVSLDNQLLDDSQESTPETVWLHAHCAEYGFILRYPPDRADVTGIEYEPWHYRYVGREAAQFLTEHGMVLEDFWSESLP